MRFPSAIAIHVDSMINSLALPNIFEISFDALTAAVGAS
jgi:hypothetical protein